MHDNNKNKNDNNDNNDNDDDKPISHQSLFVFLCSLLLLNTTSSKPQYKNNTIMMQGKQEQEQSPSPSSQQVIKSKGENNFLARNTFRKKKSLLLGVTLVVLSLRNVWILHVPVTIFSMEHQQQSNDNNNNGNHAFVVASGNGGDSPKNNNNDDYDDEQHQQQHRAEEEQAATVPSSSSSVSPSQKELQHTPLQDLFQYPPPKSTFHNATRVIAMISMGPAAKKSILVERCVRSLRTRGEYDGLIWLLTDSPPSRFQSIMSRDPNFIAMPPPRHLQDWKWHLPDDMPYKRFKTYLMEYIDIIPSPYTERFQNIEWVYYLDIDIVAGQPIRHWFQHVEETIYKTTIQQQRQQQLIQNKDDQEQQQQPLPSQMLVFEGNYAHAPLQGGQFVLHKETINLQQPNKQQLPNRCLERWRHYIDQNPEESKDQKALFQLWNETQGIYNNDNTIENNNINNDDDKATSSSSSSSSSSFCKITLMSKEPYLHFIDRDNIQHYVRTNKAPMDYGTLMHIKNTQSIKKRIAPKKLKEFFNGLFTNNLTTQEKNWIVRSSYNVEANHTWSKEQLELWKK